jgi:hypothetical protein
MGQANRYMYASNYIPKISTILCNGVSTLDENIATLDENVATLNENVATLDESICDMLDLTSYFSHCLVSIRLCT